MAELALVGSIIAVIQISQDVVTRAYKYGQAVKHAKEDMERVRTELQDLENTLRKLENLAQRATASGRSLVLWPTLVSLQDPASPLQECRSELAKLQSGLAQVGFWEKSKARALWPQKQKGISRILATIRQQKAHLVEALNIDQADQILETSQVVDDTARLQIDHKEVSESTNFEVAGLKENQIIRWLRSTDASINHVAAIDKRMKSTGQWFLDSTEYDSWKHGGSSFLWLHGPSGCGKTVLCSSAVDDTLASCKGNPLAYYYFDITDREKQAVSNFLRSILAQLCSKMAAIPEAVSALHETYKAGSRIPQQTLIDTLVIVLPQINKPRIFIDALDECEEMDDLLDLIKSLHTNSGGNLQMFVTSQKQQQIADVLQDIATENISVQGDLIDRDIGLHVRERLTKDSKLRKWRNLPITDDIVTALQNGAGGSFRWASCQIDSLRGCLSEDDVRSALGDLPPDLNTTYDRILNKIYYQNGASQGRTAARIRAVLQWLTFAQRPLLLEEVAEAAAIDPEQPFKVSSRVPDPHYISDSCSSLVTITLSTRRRCTGREELKFAHPSVQRYLTSERLRSEVGPASSFAFSEIDANSFIARACLRYLLQFNKPDSLSSDISTNFPLAAYSAEFSWTHYRAIGDNPYRAAVDDLGIQLMNFESNSFRNWIRISDPRGRFRGINLQQMEFVSPLYNASLEGLLGLARRLLERGADVNAQGGTYDSALLAATVGGHGAVAQLVLTNGADVNAHSRFYGSALQAAAYMGHVALAQLLVTNEADVNALGGHFGSALQAAAYMGHVALAQLLVTNEADVNALGGHFGSALIAAAATGHGAVAQLLLTNGADVNAHSGYHGSVLQATAYGGHVALAQLLLTNGADVNAHSGFYGNALQAAAHVNGVALAQLLLTNGADVNALGGEFGSALQAAAVRGHIAVAQLLLTNEADVNAQGGHDGSALQAAISTGDTEFVRLLLSEGAAVRPEWVIGTPFKHICYEMLELLLSHGFDLTTLDLQGRSMLHRMSLGGNIEMITSLLSLDMDARALDKQGCSCLHLALASGDIQTIETFLNLGLDPRDLDKQGRNGLHHAALGGWADTTDRLLREQLDPNSVDRDGWTPLHWAAKGEGAQKWNEKRWDDTVLSLLDAGADPKLKTTDGWTPHCVAIFHQRTRLLSLLAFGDEIVVNPGYWHEDFRCSGCDMGIYGRRYRCLVCPQPRGFDFCFKCNYSAAETHPHHEFELIEAPDEVRPGEGSPDKGSSDQE